MSIWPDLWNQDNNFCLFRIKRKRAQQGAFFLWPDGRQGKIIREPGDAKTRRPMLKLSNQ